MPNRDRLPTRRRCETLKIEWQEPGGGAVPMFVTVGYSDALQPLEIFIDTAKSGTLLRALMHEGAILASLCLQLGADPRDLADSMARIDETGELAASPLGLALRTLADSEQPKEAA